MISLFSKLILDANMVKSFAKLVRHAVDEVARRLRETIYKSMGKSSCKSIVYILFIQ